MQDSLWYCLRRRGGWTRNTYRSNGHSILGPDFSKTYRKPTKKRTNVDVPRPSSGIGALDHSFHRWCWNKLPSSITKDLGVASRNILQL